MEEKTLKIVLALIIVIMVSVYCTGLLVINLEHKNIRVLNKEISGLRNLYKTNILHFDIMKQCMVKISDYQISSCTRRYKHKNKMIKMKVNYFDFTQKESIDFYVYEYYLFGLIEKKICEFCCKNFLEVIEFIEEHGFTLNLTEEQETDLFIEGYSFRMEE